MKITKKGNFCKTIFFPHFLSQISLFHRGNFQPFPQDGKHFRIFHTGKNFSNGFPLSANDGHTPEKACPRLAFFTFPPFQPTLSLLLLTYNISYLFSFCGFRNACAFWNVDFSTKPIFPNPRTSSSVFSQNGFSEKPKTPFLRKDSKLS